MPQGGSVVNGTHDQTLASAIGAALDRVAYHLNVDDELMASVYGAIVRKLLAHPCSVLYSAHLPWRRMLERWEQLRKQLDAPPLDLVELIDHHANVLLVEATRASEREAKSA